MSDSYFYLLIFAAASCILSSAYRAYKFNYSLVPWVKETFIIPYYIAFPLSIVLSYSTNLATETVVLVGGLTGNLMYGAYNFLVISKIDQISSETRKQLAAKYSLEKIDGLDGHEFERVVVDIFRHYGFQTINTKGSGDQGADVILIKSGIRIAIQCKCYSDKVTNKVGLTPSLDHL